MLEVDVAPSVILDPSVLFTPEGLTWLQDPQLRPHLAVSQSLWQQLNQVGPISDQLTSWGVPTDGALFEEVILGLDPITKVSYGDEILPDLARAIVSNLLLTDDPMATVVADEWAFLTTHSIAVLAHRFRRTLHMLVQAGVQVYEVAREEVERGLHEIRDHLSPEVLDKLKRIGAFPVDPFPKLLLLGGDIAGFFIPYVGIPLGVAQAVQQGIAIVGGDP